MNITRDLFLRIHSMDARIHFPTSHMFLGRVQLELWNVLINNSFHLEEDYFPILFEKDFTIKGQSIITLEDVYGGSFSVALYESDGMTLLKDANGQTSYVKKVWGSKASNEEEIYHFNGISLEPQGSLDLQLFSCGKVTIAFDTEDCEVEL